MKDGVGKTVKDRHLTLNELVKAIRELKAYRLSGWRRWLDPGSILEHPSDLLQVLPGTLAASSGRLQLIESVLKCFRVLNIVFY